MKQAYAHAIAGYRFYSYGDACLLFRGQHSIAATDDLRTGGQRYS